jgi:hypothetical protein
LDNPLFSCPLKISQFVSSHWVQWHTPHKLNAGLSKTLLFSSSSSSSSSSLHLHLHHSTLTIRFNTWHMNPLGFLACSEIDRGRKQFVYVIKIVVPNQFLFIWFFRNVFILYFNGSEQILFPLIKDPGRFTYRTVKEDFFHFTKQCLWEENGWYSNFIFREPNLMCEHICCLVSNIRLCCQEASFHLEFGEWLKYLTVWRSSSQNAPSLTLLWNVRQKWYVIIKTL